MTTAIPTEINWIDPMTVNFNVSSVSTFTTILVQTLSSICACQIDNQ
jgi:hypothetical protein